MPWMMSRERVELVSVTAAVAAPTTINVAGIVARYPIRAITNGAINVPVIAAANVNVVMYPIVDRDAPILSAYTGTKAK